VISIIAAIAPVLASAFVALLGADSTSRIANRIDRLNTAAGLVVATPDVEAAIKTRIAAEARHMVTALTRRERLRKQKEPLTLALLVPVLSAVVLVAYTQWEGTVTVGFSLVGALLGYVLLSAAGVIASYKSMRYLFNKLDQPLPGEPQ
jgi:hypothetical protein